LIAIFYYTLKIQFFQLIIEEISFNIALAASGRARVAAAALRAEMILLQQTSVFNREQAFSTVNSSLRIIFAALLRAKYSALSS
jgi:hypothetical protein